MSGLSARPWRKRTLNDGSRNIVSGSGGLGFVCQYSHRDGEDREQAEVDGSLIEAAPELLAWVKERLGECGCAGIDTCDPCRAGAALVDRVETRT